MWELYNNLLKYFRFGLSVHVGIIWKYAGSHRIFQVAFMKLAEKKEKKAKKNKQQDILAKSHFAWLLRQKLPSKLSVSLYPFQRQSMREMYTASAV